MTKLPKRQQQLYDLLFGRGDVPIAELYAAMAPNPDLDATPRRQQWLGPYIRALNRRIAAEGLKVEPGDLKNTYRLVVLKA